MTLMNQETELQTKKDILNETQADTENDQHIAVTENDTTKLEQEIIRNEEIYYKALNDTTKLEKEIIENEEKWRKYVKSVPQRQKQEYKQRPISNNNRKDKNNEQKSNSNENNNNKNQDNNNNNNGNNNNGNNNNGNNNNGDEKKDDNDEDKEESDSDGEDEKSFDVSILKAKMKKVKTFPNYKKLKKTKKYGLNDNELMAVVYYCDCDSACSQMKRAHRCKITDVYWKKLYYHCTNAIEKMYKVFHCKNEEFKKQYSLSQKLYHGSTIKELSTYDKEQFFFKTMTSFSTKNYIAKEFAADKGMIFIINGAFIGLYDGHLRGANVHWLSNFQEYEFIILPTTYAKIIEIKNHGILLQPEQKVYISQDFKTNKDPLASHADTVPKSIEISYKQFQQNSEQKNNVNDEIIDASETESEQKASNTVNNQERIHDYTLERRINRCNCELKHSDTIPPHQHDISVYSTEQLDHIKLHHKKLYEILTTWKKDNDTLKAGNLNPTEHVVQKWDTMPSYFIQVTSVGIDDFYVEIAANVAEKSKKKYWIKDLKNIVQPIVIKKGKYSAEIDIEMDEKHSDSYNLGLYESKQAKHVILNSNCIHLVTITNDDHIPPQNKNYKPKCIDLSTLILAKDVKNQKINIYWSIPPFSFGEITYKIVNRHDKKTEIVSLLPYSIPYHSSKTLFSVVTIATVEDKVYESDLSEAIII
eukprot:39253_1